MTGARAPIRTLVVDDDFHVAHIHAASVDRLEGFTCVGQAYTAAETREQLGLGPVDLLLLDIYLPDEDGLSLLRSLTGAGSAPDCIFITAARDLGSVRSAIGLGAVSYLVKPVRFAHLKEKLEAYRRWRDELAASAEGETDQETVDTLYELLRGSRDIARRLPPTMANVLEAVRTAKRPVSASSIAADLGISRPTAQRYLNDLRKRGAVELELEYGSTGRPVNLYRPRR